MKKLLAFLLFFVFLLTLCSCETQRKETKEPEQAVSDETKDTEQAVIEETKETEQEVSIKDYTTAAAALNEDIYQASVILSNVGKYIYNYWKALDSVGGNFKTDNAIEKADEWLQKNSDESIETIKASYADIADRYAELLRMNISDPVAEKTTEKISDMYDTYCTFYSTVISPQGERSEFSEIYSDCTTSITTAYEAIDTVLH